MSIRGKHGYDQLLMWDDWHSRHVADDDSPLHLACRDDLLSRLAPPPDSGPVLELGSGQGFDAIAIGEAGYTVEALEFSSVALSIARKNLTRRDGLCVNYAKRDISDSLPYSEAAFSGIFSYLALHYFDSNVTEKVFAEIARVAATNCIFSFAVRSTEDPLFGKGEQLGRHLYINRGHVRHFFDIDELANLLKESWTIEELRLSRAHYPSRSVPEGGVIKCLAFRH